MIDFNNLVDSDDKVIDLTPEPIDSKKGELEVVPPVNDDNPVDPPIVGEPDNPVDPDPGVLVDNLDSYAPEIAQYMFDKKTIKHIPSDVDPESFNMEAYEKTIKYNIQKESEAAYIKGTEDTKNGIVSRLSPLAQKIVSYSLDNPNADDQEIKSLAFELDTADRLKNLTVENNSTEIIKEYYRNAKWSEEEINSKLESLIVSESLESEAKILKPKLDSIAEVIATQRQQDKDRIKEFEKEQSSKLEERLLGTLQKGEINGIPITQEIAKFGYNAVMNESVPVQIGDKTIHMGYAEALMRQQKYQGNIENVIISLLVLRDGAESVKKYFSTQKNNEDIRKKVEQIKFRNNNIKSGTTVPGKKEESTGFKFKVK